jgi:hypothetical protein
MLSRLRISEIAASISLTASAITSGVIALTRITSADDGELLIRSGSSIVGHAPSNFSSASHGHLLPTDISAGASITTTPTVQLTVNIPEAGEYLLRCDLTTAVATVVGARTLSVTFDSTNFVSCALTAVAVVSTPAMGSRATITTNGATFSHSMVTNASGELRTFGKLVVSAAAVVTMTISISGDSGTLRGGSFMSATRIA